MSDPTTIYLPPDLKDRIRVIARKRGRKVSPQIVRWCERIVEKLETKDSGERSRTRKGLCRV